MDLTKEADTVLTEFFTSRGVSLSIMPPDLYERVLQHVVGFVLWHAGCWPDHIDPCGSCDRDCLQVDCCGRWMWGCEVTGDREDPLIRVCKSHEETEGDAR